MIEMWLVRAVFSPNYLRLSIAEGPLPANSRGIKFTNSPEYEWPWFME